MERRLFEELVVPPGPGGGRRRAGLLPVSLVIHAVVLGVILVVPVLTPDGLPRLATSATDDLMVPAMLVPPPPPPRGVSPGDVVRWSSRGPAPVRSVSSPAISLPTDWSELSSDADALWAPGDLPLCEGCVPWGVDDGVPGLEPPPPPEAPDEPVVRTGGVIEPPLKVRDQAPVYPELARSIGLEGVVIIECRVDTAGDVVDARVLRGHPLLDAAALEAVRRWRYRPTLLNGRRVSVLMTVTVRFQLRRL